jgi:hypothetical protein
VRREAWEIRPPSYTLPLLGRGGGSILEAVRDNFILGAVRHRVNEKYSSVNFTQLVMPKKKTICGTYRDGQD